MTENRRESIIIVSYQFCPRGRIGTRRWSKFAKYLSRLYKVHVICAKYPFRDKLNWCEDVEGNPNIIIHKTNTIYPSLAIHENRSFVVKILFNALNVYPFYKDEAQYWKKSLFLKIDELRLNENIKNIIVTGAPFSPLHHMAIYKEKHPEINLILDLRDPWMQLLNKNYKFFSHWKFNKELQNEDFAFQMADKILLVTQTFKEQYQQIYPQFSDKMTTVFNGFDAEDFDKVMESRIAESKIAYAGALFKGRADGMMLLIKALEKYNKSSKNICTIDIYSNQLDPKFEKEVKSNLNSFVFLKSPLPQKQLFKALKSYAYLLTINEKRAPFAFGTKAFEYIALGKKIILISPDGELYQLLKSKNQLVSDYSESQINKMSKKLFRDIEENFIASPKDLYDDFSIKSLTESLIPSFK